MTDAQLRTIIPKHLTPEGRRCYEREFARRGFISRPLLLDERLVENAKALANKARQQASEKPPPKVAGFHVSIQEIKSRYQRLTDEELHSIAPRDLTPEALSCYADEARLRALSIDLTSPPPQPPKMSGFHVPIQEIKSRYQRLTDEELHSTAPRDLTPEALSCYAEETRLRALPIDLPPPNLTSPPPQPPKMPGFHVPIQEIKSRYQRLTDEQLLRMDPKGLTTEALFVTPRKPDYARSPSTLNHLTFHHRPLSRPRIAR